MNSGYLHPRMYIKTNPVLKNGLPCVIPRLKRERREKDEEIEKKKTKNIYTVIRSLCGSARMKANIAFGNCRQ